MSAIVASTVTWTARYMEIRGIVVAVFTVGGSVGAMSVVAITGYLFQILGHMSLPYMCLSVCLLGDFLFIAMHVLATRFATRLDDSRNEKISRADVLKEISSSV